MPREFILTALPIAAGLLLVGAIALYTLEHGRRMRDHGLTLIGKPLPGGDASKSTPPALSPWLAAGALMALGSYLAYDNLLDESMHDNAISIAGAGCSITYSAPAEARPTSVIAIELRTQDAACADRVRRAQLILDGAPAKDAFPFSSVEGTTIRRRWLAPPFGSGEHRIDLVDSAQTDAGLLSRTIAVADLDSVHRQPAKRPPTHSAFCNSVLSDPDPLGIKDQYVAVTLTTECAPDKAVPSLMLNGVIDTALLTGPHIAKRYTYLWFFKRSAIPDRVDVVFTNPQLLYAAPLAVRQPLGVSGVKDVLASTGGAVVALSGLIVAIFQFLRGQSATPAA